MPIFPVAFPDAVGGNRGDVRRGLVGPGKTSLAPDKIIPRGLQPVPYSPAYIESITYTTSDIIDYAPQLCVCDATSASIVLTLPPSASCMGRCIYAVKMDSSTNTVTFSAPTGTSLFYYSTWTGLTKQYETVYLLSMLDVSGNPGWLVMLEKPVV